MVPATPDATPAGQPGTDLPAPTTAGQVSGPQGKDLPPTVSDLPTDASSLPESAPGASPAATAGAVPVDPARITFIMVGCQRCGTTWVDAALREHPQVYLPPQKQTYYFDRHLDRGDAWYLGQFAGATDRHRAVGEVATGYSLPHAVPHLARLLPHVRILMAVRHPVERLYSNYQVRKQESGWRSLEDAIARDPDLIERGRYMDQIDDLLRFYPRDRLCILFQEDLDRDDRAYLRQILSFIGVAPDLESSQFGKQRNSAMFPRLRRVMQGLGLRPVLRRLSRSVVGESIRTAKKRWIGRGYAPMKPGTRAHLIEVFRDGNRRLAAFTGRDLSHWDR
ncbi:MAG: sulfotransferase [Phycisphaeraceae bacterium]|nr:sulfotransferase [Phycisphaeraceae bacterium]